MLAIRAELKPNTFFPQNIDTLCSPTKTGQGQQLCRTSTTECTTVHFHFNVSDSKKNLYHLPMTITSELSKGVFVFFINSNYTPVVTIIHHLMLNVNHTCFASNCISITIQWSVEHQYSVSLGRVYALWIHMERNSQRTWKIWLWCLRGGRKKTQKKTPHTQQQQHRKYRKISQS